jgi:hypothetical protein
MRSSLDARPCGRHVRARGIRDAPRGDAARALTVDWLTFISSLVGSLAWPAMVVVLAVIFRPQVTRLFSTVRRLKWGSLDADLDERLEAVTREAEQVLPPPQRPSQDAAESESTFARILRRADPLERLAEDAPRAAIIDAWIAVEDALRAAAGRAGVGTHLPVTSASVLNELGRRGIVDPSLAALINELHALRNEAVHAREFKVGRDEALKYAYVARLVADTLGRVARPTHAGPATPP